MVESITIVGCPTVRAKDDLAVSARNVFLDFANPFSPEPFGGFIQSSSHVSCG